MAADWIKMRTDLYRDPKVCMMADCLLSDDGELARYVSQICQRNMTVTRNVLRNAIVGSLVTVWGVVRHRGKRKDDDLVLEGAILAVVDDISEMPGFGEAMEAVGWVENTEESLVFPRFFAEFNTPPETSNAKSGAQRQKLYRERKRNVTVTSPLPSQNPLRDDREEKSREEKINKDTPPAHEVEENDELPGNEEPHHAKRPFDLASLTEDQVVAMADRDLIPKEFAVEQYNAAMGRGGNDWNGVRIQSWRHFIKGEYERSKRMEKTAQKGNSGANGGFVNPRHEARKRLEEKDWSKVDRF